MEAQLTIESILDRFQVRNPNEEELAMMNACKPRGMPDYTAAEVVHVPILGSTNLLFKSPLQAWTPDVMRSMAATYKGKDLILNHELYSVEKSIGFVYDSELFHVQNLTQAGLDLISETSTDIEIDRSILQKFGLYQVVCYGCVSADHPAMDAIRFRRLADVSTGGWFTNEQLICPLCNTEFQAEDICDHYPPSWYADLLVEWGELKREQIAPFMFVNGFHESLELSFVGEGNCPQAEIFSEKMSSFVYY